MIVWIAVGVCWLFVVIPAVLYLLTTWKTRRDAILGAFDENSLKHYYRQVQGSLPAGNLVRAYEKTFGRHFGRRHYIAPLALLGSVSGIGLYTTASTANAWLHRQAAFPPLVVASFLGAFVWVLYDQFARCCSRDFTPHHVYHGVFRLLIAVPVGFAFVSLFKEDAGVFVAFGLNAFPY